MAPAPRLGSRTKLALFTAAAFAGGAATSHLAHARPAGSSPYAPLDQLARVLVLVENQYVEPAARKKMLDGAIKGMVAELDPHSAYMPPEEFALFQEETGGRFGGVGVEVDYRDDYITVIAPFEGSPADRAGIKSGDQFISVDGKPMRGEPIEKLVKIMRGEPGTKVRVQVRRKGVAEPLTFELTREIIRVTSVVSTRMAGDVAYVRIKQFQEGTHEELLAAAGKIRAASKAPPRAVILDMRDNPGGLVNEAEGVADEFLGGGSIYSLRHRSKVVEEVRASSGGAFAGIPTVILVSPYSASSSELVAGALQDSGRATVLGQGTFGKGSVQTIFDLPGGAGIRLTTMRYYTPSGRSIQAQGIRPDLLVEELADPGKSAEQIFRESDLEGHLEAESAAGAERPQRKVKVPASKAPVPAREPPVDPLKAGDEPLKVAYALALRKAGAAAAQSAKR